MSGGKREQVLEELRESVVANTPQSQQGWLSQVSANEWQEVLHQALSAAGMDNETVTEAEAASWADEMQLEANTDNASRAGQQGQGGKSTLSTASYSESLAACNMLSEQGAVELLQEIAEAETQAQGQLARQWLACLLSSEQGSPDAMLLWFQGQMHQLEEAEDLDAYAVAWSGVCQRTCALGQVMALDTAGHQMALLDCVSQLCEHAYACIEAQQEDDLTLNTKGSAVRRIYAQMERMVTMTALAELLHPESGLLVTQILLFWLTLACHYPCVRATSGGDALEVHDSRLKRASQLVLVFAETNADMVLDVLLGCEVDPLAVGSGALASLLALFWSEFAGDLEAQMSGSIEASLKMFIAARKSFKFWAAREEEDAQQELRAQMRAWQPCPALARLLDVSKHELLDHLSHHMGLQGMVRVLEELDASDIPAEDDGEHDGRVAVVPETPQEDDNEDLGGASAIVGVEEYGKRAREESEEQDEEDEDEDEGVAKSRPKRRRGSSNRS